MNIPYDTNADRLEAKTDVRPSQPRRSIISSSLMVVMPLLVLGLAAAGYSAMLSSKSYVKPRIQREKIWAVRTVAASVGAHQGELQLYGEIVAGRKVELRTLVAGEIVSTGKTLREGASVSKGDELISIDAFTYQASLSEAKSHLKEAYAKQAEIEARIGMETRALEFGQEQLALAQRDHERILKLKKNKIVADKVVDDRMLILSQRQQTVRQRRDNLMIEHARAQQQRAAIERLVWGVQRAKRNLQNTVLKAPFDAYMVGVNADKGRLVSVNDRIVTLIARDEADVRFSVSDQQYGRFLAGQGTIIGKAVRIIWQTGSKALKLHGKVERVGAQISSATGSVDVYARITSAPEHLRSLRSGAFVEVFMKDREMGEVARLPETALYGVNSVFIVRNRRLVSRKISLVGYSGRNILVQGALKSGDQVLTTQLPHASEGLLVKVIEP